MSCSLGMIRSVLVSLFQDFLFFLSLVSHSTHWALNFIDVILFQLINQSKSSSAPWEGLNSAIRVWAGLSLAEPGLKWAI